MTSQFLSLTSPKNLSPLSNFVVDVIMWPNFNNCSITVREVLIISILWRFEQKNHFFDWLSGPKFNNFEPARRIALKVYTTLSKGLKVKVRKLLVLIRTVAGVTGVILLGRRVFATPSLVSSIRLAHGYSFLYCSTLSYIYW